MRESVLPEDLCLIHSRDSLIPLLETGGDGIAPVGILLSILGLLRGTDQVFDLIVTTLGECVLQGCLEAVSDHDLGGDRVVTAGDGLWSHELAHAPDADEQHEDAYDDRGAADGGLVVGMFERCAHYALPFVDVVVRDINYSISYI